MKYPTELGTSDTTNIRLHDHPAIGAGFEAVVAPLAARLYPYCLVLIAFLILLEVDGLKSLQLADGAPNFS